MEFVELIPGLPEEISLECLARFPYTAYRAAAQVCRRWRRLLGSREFYSQRKQSGNTRKVACLVQSLPQPTQTASDGQKPAYGISMFDPLSGCWERIDPLPKYPNGLPLFCQLASSEAKLVVLGGWDPASWEPVRDVFVYDFTHSRWKQGKDMPSKRSFFATGAVEGRVLVAGGHDESKNALRSAWAYDVRRDEWEELKEMSEERDECEGVVIGTEFWVVSGYGTERQGMFEGSAEAYEVGTGEWRRVEEAWAVNRCPRGCVGVGKDGGLFSWAEWEGQAGVRVGPCAVGLGDLTLVTGCADQGAPRAQGSHFYLVKRVEGGFSRKLDKLDVADEFCGFVQSSCCVEI